MGVTVKKAVIWRKEVRNTPGVLASTLKPLADAGVNVQVLMGYAYPGDNNKSAIEVYPISSAKAIAAAKSAKLLPSSSIACLHVQGDDEVGLGARIAQQLGSAKINVSFVMVQVVGKKYSGFFGFENEMAAERAMKIIKGGGKLVAMPKKSAAKKSSSAGKKKTAAKSKTKAKSKSKSSAKVKPIAAKKKTATRKAAQKKLTVAKKPAAKKTAKKKRK